MGYSAPKSLLPRTLVWGLARRVHLLAGPSGPRPLLGGSWVVISGVISGVAIITIHIRGHISPLKQASRACNPIDPNPKPQDP